MINFFCVIYSLYISIFFFSFGPARWLSGKKHFACKPGDLIPKTHIKVDGEN